jgi:hypothetical protein
MSAIRSNFLLALALFASCATVQELPGTAQTDEGKIHFLVLNISQVSKQAMPAVMLISKAAGSGSLKKHAQQVPATGNRLTIYLQNHRRRIDSITIGHPLHQHYEYADEAYNMVAKDTVATKADFIVRFQTQTPATHIIITETLLNKGTRTLGTIKL